ncbi:MAG: phenazine biosynthesis protein PhzF [Methylibium sp. NZG]|nr:MAG: phenazine biosynthesis protein PhzF [Methylibium sp. NZG]
MTQHAFTQVDVFTDTPLLGNPLAVVHGADALSDAQMQSLARWTNLSETSFLLQPTDPAADYRVRIFTPARELPFAGHPTLGSCHAWLESIERAGGSAGGSAGVSSSGRPKGGQVVQQCGVGLVRIRRDGARLAFAAPPLRRSGAVEPQVLAHIARALRIDVQAIRASQWTDNGPGWVAVMLSSRDELLAVRPDHVAMQGLAIGAVAPWPGGDAQFEVRAFVADAGGYEDPVTGSLNAGLAQWLIGAGLAPPKYIASQGTVLQRAGRVHVEVQGSDTWIGGHSVTCVRGELTLADAVATAR